MRKSLLTLAVALLIGPSCGGDSPERIVGGNGSFEAASVTIGNGFAGMGAIDGGVCGPDYVNTFTVTTQPPVATWSACLTVAPAPPPGQGSRPVTATEIASIADALRQVQVGPSAFCKKDGDVITLDIQANGTTGRYIDLPSACEAAGPGPEGRTYVTGLRAVEHAMWSLSQ